MKQLPVFVYGTLRPGCGNFAWTLAGNTAAITPATLDGATMYRGPGFPYVAAGDGVVVGDLIDITADRYDDVLATLDGLEGYRPGHRGGSHYDRVQCTVMTPDGPRQAWVYMVNQQLGREPIPSGDWLVATTAVAG